MVTELLSDKMISTSTWIDWEAISFGRVRHDWPSAGSFFDPMDQLLRARFAAQSARTRVESVLGPGARTSALLAQVQTVDAITDLLLGTGGARHPLAPSAQRSPEADLFKQAIQKFTTALTTARRSPAT